VEHASFSPLIFSTSAGMGKSTSIVYKRLAHLLSVKRDEPYCSTIPWLWYRLEFALLRSSIMCLRGSRSLHTYNNECPSSFSQWGMHPLWITILTWTDFNISFLFYNMCNVCSILFFMYIWL
jgi:hypothetical protein